VLTGECWAPKRGQRDAIRFGQIDQQASATVRRRRCAGRLTVRRSRWRRPRCRARATTATPVARRPPVPAATAPATGTDARHRRRQRRSPRRRFSHDTRLGVMTGSAGTQDRPFDHVHCLHAAYRLDGDHLAGRATASVRPRKKQRPIGPAAGPVQLVQDHHHGTPAGGDPAQVSEQARHVPDVQAGGRSSSRITGALVASAARAAHAAVRRARSW